MRDPARIDRLLTALGTLWKRPGVNQQRLGQLILNLGRNVDGAVDGDHAWNLEDDAWLKRIEQELKQPLKILDEG